MRIFSDLILFLIWKEIFIMVKKLGQECNFFIIYIYCEYYNHAEWDICRYSRIEFSWVFARHRARLRRNISTWKLVLGERCFSQLVSLANHSRLVTCREVHGLKSLYNSPGQEKYLFRVPISSRGDVNTFLSKYLHFFNKTLKS